MDWQERWVAKSTPWDLNGPHPETAKIIEILKKYSITPQNILIPGCGRAHDAIPFLNSNAKVTAIDLAPEAIVQAKIFYGQNSDISFHAIDNGAFVQTLEKKFDLVFDRAMLCAIPLSSRQDYINHMDHALVDEGLFVSIAFQKIRPEIEGPPFAISEHQMFELMKEKFTLLEAYQVTCTSPIPAILGETAWLWKKRKA